MTTIDLRIDAGWIVPVEPRGALTDHALLIDGGRVLAIEPRTRADQLYVARERVSLPNHSLIPGLVNAHTHAAMALFRGIADDLPLHPWLEKHIWPREMKFVTDEFVHDGTLLAAAEMLKGGVTCFSDMYFHLDAAARACRATGIRGMLGILVVDFPTSYAADWEGYLDRGFAVRDAQRDQPTLYFALAPHATYTVADAVWAKIVMFARELQLPIHTHVSESLEEVAACRERHRVTPLAHLHRLGATGPGFIGVHAVHLEPADIDILATHGGSIVHCPASNMKLANGIAPIAALVGRGVNVGLGTDGAASNNRLDILGEARLAALLAKASTGDAAVIPAWQALEMATLGGARALGLDDHLGSLAPGKAADVVAVDFSGVAARPCYDPVSHLIHVTGAADVTDVWVAGRRVVGDGMLTQTDEAAIIARAQLWQERLK